GKPQVGTIALNAFQKGNHVVIEIEDDGRGIDPRALVDAATRRGVIGADEVKTNIGKLGGVIDLQSEEGIGTKVTVTLPITLAIISALVVKLGERLFAIPLANVQEAVVLDPAGVRIIEGREVVTLRGVSLQLCRLARLFDLEEHEPPAF